MKKQLLLLALPLLGYIKHYAQNSADIIQGLKKLNTVGSVLYVAAHPDDENTRLLGYLANEKKFRTGYLSLTRGDGGQNLIGKEQGELLGLIRTQELLAARRIDGAEQYFTRANDFGILKEEAYLAIFRFRELVNLEKNRDEFVMNNHEGQFLIVKNSEAIHGRDRVEDELLGKRLLIAFALRLQPKPSSKAQSPIEAEKFSEKKLCPYNF